MTRSQTRTSDATIAAPALACAALAVGMVGLAYASVPLYDLFCKVTGFDGTPIVAHAAAAEVIDRTIAVRFDANVSPGLNWSFAPETPEVRVKARRDHDGLLQGHQRRRDADDRHRHLQRRSLISPAPISSSSSASASRNRPCSPARASNSAVVFYVDPALVRGSPTSRTSTPSPCPTPTSRPRAASRWRRPRRPQRNRTLNKRRDKLGGNVLARPSAALSDHASEHGDDTNGRGPRQASRLPPC